MTVTIALAGCGGSFTATSGHTTTSTAAGVAAHASTGASSQGVTGESPQTVPGAVVAQPSAPLSSSAAGVVLGTSRGVTATLHAGTHHPKVERPWPIHFTVTRSGGPARATLEYEYLFGGQVVAHRSHYTFTSHFSDVFKWPASVHALGVSAYVSPSVTAWGLGRALLVGVAIGVLGGIYPAWRVTRMTPLKALAGT